MIGSLSRHLSVWTYSASGKKLFKVGMVFDAKPRTLGGWKALEE
jgi:hypothetical protein